MTKKCTKFGKISENLADKFRLYSQMKLWDVSYASSSTGDSPAPHAEADAAMKSLNTGPNAGLYCVAGFINRPSRSPTTSGSPLLRAIFHCLEDDSISRHLPLFHANAKPLPCKRETRLLFNFFPLQTDQTGSSVDPRSTYQVKWSRYHGNCKTKQFFLHISLFYFCLRLQANCKARCRKNFLIVFFCHIHSSLASTPLLGMHAAIIHAWKPPHETRMRTCDLAAACEAQGRECVWQASERLWTSLLLAVLPVWMIWNARAPSIYKLFHVTLLCWSFVRKFYLVSARSVERCRFENHSKTVCVLFTEYYILLLNESILLWADVQSATCWWCGFVTECAQQASLTFDDFYSKQSTFPRLHQPKVPSKQFTIRQSLHRFHSVSRVWLYLNPFCRYQ